MNEKNPKLLIIDDSPEDQELYIRLLKKYDDCILQMFTADTGEDGLEMYFREKPACILLDYNLPDMNGLEVLQALSKHVLTNKVAVIMLTGEGDESIAVEAMKSGALDYLIKGKVNSNSLRQSIFYSMEKARMKHEIERQRIELEQRNEELDKLVVQLQAAKEELYTQATKDALTGINNRRQIIKRLEEEFSSSRRYNYPLSISMIDLDRFKQINDTYGHLTGDIVLVRFSKLMVKELRSEDIVGRLGGDEFMVISPHTHAKDTAIGLERIRKKFSEILFKSDKGAFNTAATFGVSQLNPDYETIDDFIESADKALYKAKEQGRNKLVIL